MEFVLHPWHVLLNAQAVDQVPQARSSLILIEISHEILTHAPQTKTVKPRLSFLTIRHQLWDLMVSFKDEELLAKGKILSRQIRDDVGLSREISTAILDDFKHQLSLRGEECKFNGSNAYE